MTEWWQMGGYAAEVWSAYGLFVVAIVGFGWSSWRQEKRR